MENTVTPSRIVTAYRKGAMTMSFWKKQKETEKVPQSVEHEMPQSAQEHSAQGETKAACSVDAYLQSLITQAELSHNEPPAEVRKPLRKREHQICIRLSDDEKKKFLAKLKASGKSQQTFVLDAVLRGGEDRRLEECAQEIENICAEVDDQISLLRGVLKNNPKRKETNPEDWAFILQTIKDLEDMKKRCLRMMEGIYGNY